jgi:hypothetical protein
MFQFPRFFSFALCCIVAALFAACPVGAVDDREGVLVGRVSHVEGKLLRYVEEENDWVLTVKDAPFGLEDALYAGEDAKAEFIMPSGAWVRVGANTQLQLIDMDMGATTLDVASGMARFYNKSRDGVIKVTTPFGYAVAPAGSAFDLYVGDESMEVIAVRGAVDFVHDASGSRYQVREGSNSIIADGQSTARGNGAVDGDWDDWNNSRESVWAKREQSRSRMADLLPEPIREESYVLEDNGRWERVQYEGAYRDMWRPTRIDPGWRPFTAGRWTQYYGDNCWIPDEPFGYVTHHYGSWVYVDAFRAWYWMPPVVRRHAATPTIFISFGWYPGRVGWIRSHDSIGWVPLGPNEIYYGHRPWGHRTKVVNHTTVNIITINKYRYLNEAVVVNRDQLYRGNRYTPHLRRDFDRNELVRSFKPMPVVASFENDKRRFAYSDAQVNRKPHAMAAERINSNQNASKGAGRLNRDRIEKDLNRVKTSAEPPPQKDMRPPTLGGRLVESGKTTAPIDRTAEPPKEIKSRDRERRITPDNRAGFDRQDRRSGDAVEPRRDGVEPKRDAANPDESRRTRPSGEGVDASRNGAEAAPQTGGGAMQGGREPGAVEQSRDAADKGDQGRERRIRSPRDRETQGPGADRGPADPDRRRPVDEKQLPAEQGVQQGQNLELNTRQEQAAGRRGQEEMQRRQQTEEQEKPQELQRSQQMEEQGKQQELQRRQQEAQGRRQEQDSQRRQEMEVKQRQEEMQQRRQQEDVQQRRQQMEEQGKQQELQRRQQEDQGRRQEQEQQRRQEMEAKQRQEESAQRQRQEEMQQRREQEAQQRQQEEARQRREQEVQQRRQAEEQGRQQELQRRQQEDQGRRQEQQRRQEEMQQRREQEAQQRQQEEARQRREQEVQQRRQAEEQGRQEMQRRQQEDQSRRQEQQQQEQRKKRKLTPEEELLQRQSGANQ